MTASATVSDRLTPDLSYPEFLRELHRHRTETSFRNSRFFQKHGEGVLRLLQTPQILPPPGAFSDGATAAPGPSEVSRDAYTWKRCGATGAPPDPAAAGALRVVQWNIEKGKAFEGLVAALREEPYLRHAGLFGLNEVDVGTARGGNCHQPAELGRRLGLHSVFLPCYIEGTKGIGDDLSFPGENRLGLHGLALLTRLPVRAAMSTPLPSCWDYFHFEEKRFGFRQGLYALLEWTGGALIAATTHLEVRNTPACRARQMAAFLDGLEEVRVKWGQDLPVVLTGDWNTNGFRRGGILNSAREFLRILRMPAARLDAELLRPFHREPLFDLLGQRGFSVEPFNDQEPTGSQDLSGVEDLKHLPGDFGRWILRRTKLEGRVLRMRLDWIAARGLAAVAPPRTLSGLVDQAGRRLSDHAAIGADLRRDAKG